MKKSYLSLLLALVLCLSLVACGGTNTDPSANTGTTPPGTQAQTGGDTTNAVTTAPTTDAATTAPTTTVPVTQPPESQAPETNPPENKPEVLPTVSANGNVIEYLYPDELTNALAENLNTHPDRFSLFADSEAPYMIQAEEFLSDGKVHSISFPLAKTEAPDSDGCYRISLYIFGKDLANGLKKSPKATFVAKINGDDYDLAPNQTVNQWIRIDVSELNISIGANETLAFFSADDTLIPYYSKSVDIKNLIDRYTDAGTGFIACLGTDALKFNANTLVFNVGMERSYTPDSDIYQEILANNAEYEQLLSQLASKYQGKKISIFGDSISTWGGISNNTEYNSTIGKNASYYSSSGSSLSDASHTYWMQVIDALGMELCVNNSWHGSRVYGRESENYVDSAVRRATQLHKDNGTPNDPSDDVMPDVIFFYMGINDINNNIKFGTLLNELATYDTLADKLDAIDGWLTDLRLRTGDFQNMNPGNQYTTLQEAYALALYQIYETYPDAEVYCINLIPNTKYMTNHQQSVADMEAFNAFVDLMAAYFEFTAVDQYHDSYMKFDTNIQFYTFDLDLLLHPNAAGHTKIAELILDTMLEKNSLK